MSKELKDILKKLKVPELKKLARDNSIRGYSKLRKAELIDFLSNSDNNKFFQYLLTKEGKSPQKNNNLSQIFNKYKVVELKKLAKDNKIKGYSKLKKADLIFLLTNDKNKNLFQHLLSKDQKKVKKDEEEKKEKEEKEEEVEYQDQDYDDKLFDDENDKKDEEDPTWFGKILAAMKGTKKEEKQKITEKLHLIDDFINAQKAFAKDEPVKYLYDTFTIPLSLLYILQRNNNDCASGIIYLHKDGPQAETIVTKGQLKKLSIDADQIKQIAKAYLRCKKRGKMLVLLLDLPGHQNLIILNYHRNELERFEPVGEQLEPKQINLDKAVANFTNLLNKEISKINSKEPKLTYISPKESCPAKKFFYVYQAIELKVPKKAKRTKKLDMVIKDPPGYCVAWSLFYGDLRLKYPKLPPQEITQKIVDILGKNPEVLRQFIRGQAKLLYKGTREILSRLLNHKDLELFLKWALGTSKKKFTQMQLNAIDDIVDIILQYTVEQFKKFTK